MLCNVDPFTTRKKEKDPQLFRSILFPKAKEQFETFRYNAFLTTVRRLLSSIDLMVDTRYSSLQACVIFRTRFFTDIFILGLKPFNPFRAPNPPYTNSK